MKRQIKSSISFTNAQQKQGILCAFNNNNIRKQHWLGRLTTMARLDWDIIFLGPTFPIRYSFALEVGPLTAATVLTLFLMQRSGQIKFRFAASANSLYEYNYWVFVFRFATQIWIVAYFISRQYSYAVRFKLYDLFCFDRTILALCRYISINLGVWCAMCIVYQSFLPNDLVSIVYLYCFIMQNFPLNTISIVLALTWFTNALLSLQSVTLQFTCFI